MKILLVTEKYWPEVGAAPSRLANMAEGLTKQGCKIDVLTALPNYPQGRIFAGYRRCFSKRECHKGVNLFRYWIFATVSSHPLSRIINMFSFGIIIWLFALKFKRVKDYDCVIIQTPTLVAASSAMIIFKKIYRKRIVLNISDLWPLTAVDMGVMKPYGRSYNFMALLEKFLYRNADGILGQSEEILNYVDWRMINNDNLAPRDEILDSKNWTKNKSLFLYRNLQSYIADGLSKKRNARMRFVYSGLLGVAQNVAGIIKNVPWRELDVEFHILGGGKQLDDIKQYIADNPDCNVFVYGFVSKEDVAGILKEMDASIVPLVTRIRGAFPSKVFDLLPQGLPILLCGEGECASFIETRKVGFTSSPSDYAGLVENIKRMKSFSEREYEELSVRCIQVSDNELDFSKQIVACHNWLLHLEKSSLQ